MRTLDAIDADLAEVEAEIQATQPHNTSGHDHARLAALHERAARLWKERAAAVGGV